MQSDILNNKELTVINFLVSFLVISIASIIKGGCLPLADWNWGIVSAVIGAEVFNILNLETLFAIILEFIFYKETPIPKELIGGIIIVISVIGTNKLES